MEILKGHVSPETAIVVDDYPYGFTLRCKIRYWLEYKPGKGFRFVSQTTNPKVAGEKWNKPKASTYLLGPAYITRNPDNGHINWSGYSFASMPNAEIAEKWLVHRDVYPPEFVPELERFIKVKREYDRLVATGMDYREASLTATRRTLPAKALKKEILAAIVASEFHIYRVEDLIATGTIGELDDFLKSKASSIKSFSDKVTA